VVISCNLLILLDVSFQKSRCRTINCDNILTFRHPPVTLTGMYLRRKKAPSGKVLQLLEAFRNSEASRANAWCSPWAMRRCLRSTGSRSAAGGATPVRPSSLFDGQARPPSGNGSIPSCGVWICAVVGGRPQGRDEAQEEPCAGGRSLRSSMAF